MLANHYHNLPDDVDFRIEAFDQVIEDTCNLIGRPIGEVMIDEVPDYTPPVCPCGKPAITFIVQIPACRECDTRYQAEGSRHLPMNERVFFKSFIDKARKKNAEKATGYTFHGY